MSNNDNDPDDDRDPDGPATVNFPGLENARDLVASSSQAVLDSVDSLNDLWGQVTGRKARLADVMYSAASAWDSYYSLAMDFLRLPLGIRDGGRPGWAIFQIRADENSPAPFDVPLSRSYDVTTTTVHKTDIQRLGGDGVIIPADKYDAKLVDKGRTLRVRLVDVRQNNPKAGDYIGLVTVPSATAPLAVVMVTVRGPGAKSSG